MVKVVTRPASSRQQAHNSGRKIGRGSSHQDWTAVQPFSLLVQAFGMLCFIALGVQQWHDLRGVAAGIGLHLMAWSWARATGGSR